MMLYKNKIFFYSLLANFVMFECASDTPCAVKQTEAGFVCVCNETYCDTINRDNPKKGRFIHYTTSEISPGFTKTVGKLFNTTINKYAYTNGSSEVQIHVSDSEQYQAYIGLGASITDSSGIAINSLGPGAQQKFFESCFGTMGAEYTTIRVPIGASDFSSSFYTYDNVPDDSDLKYFSLNPMDYKIKIPFIEKAKNISKRGIKLLGSSWSAPSWMKTNNDFHTGYLRSGYMGIWAKYLLKSMEAFSDEGIGFWGLTLGNEAILPLLLFGANFPIQNTLLPPNQAREFTKKNLGPQLKQSKYKDLKLFILDDVRPLMSWYSDRVFADEEAAQYINGIALHWYMDTEASLSQLRKFHDSYPEKDILYTESCNGGVKLGDWNKAATYIEKIMKNLNNWVTGFIDFNIALNTDGGPTGPANFSLNTQIIVNMTSGEFYKQPIYFGMAHFSKFIFPGAVRISAILEQNITAVDDEYNISLDGWIHTMKTKFSNIVSKEFMEYKSYHQSAPTASHGSVFSHNPTDASQSIVSALAVKNTDGSRTLIVYNPKPEKLTVSVIDTQLGKFQATLDPRSINSFRYR